MIDVVIFSSESFMPRANVCIASVKEHIPDANIKLCKVPDSQQNYVEGLSKARLIMAKDLIQNGSKEVMVLGADCVFYDTIESFLNMPGTVLIPHVVTPPRNNSSYYRTGHINADMILFRKESIPLLDWLISSDIKEDPNNGSFFEQTLLSSAPFFFNNISICKDPGINYAYFNFTERNLWQKSDSNDYYINDSDFLKMAQFSGYIVDEPEKISKYYNNLQPSLANPYILKLFKEYQKSIEE